MRGLIEELDDPSIFLGNCKEESGGFEGMIEEPVDACAFLGEGGIGVVTFDAGMNGRKDTSLAVVFSNSGLR